MRTPVMTREQFFHWAEAQDLPHEFDGFQPVAMNGGTIDHNQIVLNIQFALRARLQGTACRPLGPEAGVATIGDTVRYPDALVTCAKLAGDARLVPGVVVVFEVVSPTSGRTDRIIKVREYQAVASIRRYVIVERSCAGLTVLERADGVAAWTATTLTAGDVLKLPELGIELPVDALYEGVELAPAAEA